MKPAFNIAIRFFLESKRSMTLSALGVVFGVAFFICGQAQTQGFEHFFIETILGTKGAIVLMDRIKQTYSGNMRIEGAKGLSLIAIRNQLQAKYLKGIAENERLIQELMRHPNVKACSPILEANVSVKSAFAEEMGTVQGIDLDYHLKATDFEKQLSLGSLEDFRESPDALAVGSLLAEKLDLKRGQHVNLIVGGIVRRFRVTNIFETGISVIDERRLYCHMKRARKLLAEPHKVTFIMVQLKDPSRAQENAKSFETQFSQRSRAWQDREKGNLQIFATLKISAGIGVSCIIFLAGFSIFNILTMSVLEKTKEIAILRSMGYTRNDISYIFIFQGMCLAVVGILLGWVAGAAMTYGIESIPIKIRGIFKADHFMVAWSFEHYLLASVLAMISVFLASYIPASRAAKVDPVHILRGTSG